MQVTQTHALPGRIRLKYDRYSLDPRQITLVEYLLSTQEGISSVKINPVSGSILIHYDGIEEKIVLSYVAALDDKYLNDSELLDNMPPAEKQQGIAATIATMVIGHLVRKLLPLPIRKLSTAFRAAPRLKHGIKALGRKHPLNVDFLDASAISLSMANGDYSTAGVITLLLNIGETLEEYTKKKSQADLTEALSLKINTVWVEKDGQEVQIPFKDLKTEDIVIVRAGSVIPVDGSVEKGQGMVNQASMTGESESVECFKGKTVYAGTTLEDGELYIKTTALGSDSKLSGIVKMVEQSEAFKARSQQRAERLADRLVPYNFLLSALTYLFTGNMQKASSTLMVDYSCAIKLATPLAMLSAMREGAERGLVIKGGKFLENLSEADTIIFDKTGTLTTAAPKVTGVYTFGNMDRREVLKIAACLEEHFPHTLARAVVKQAEAENINHREEHTQVKYIVAHGIASELKGEKVLIGSAHFIFDDENVTCTQEERAEIDKISQSGDSMLYLAVGGRLAGIITIADPLKPEAREVINKLRQQGLSHVAMITGDGVKAAKKIAESIGADIYQGQVLPGDKSAYVDLMKKKGHKVAMVGDGINDSPALSAADVGIAMNNCADIAREVADIVLFDDSLYGLVDLRILSQRLMAKIRFNNRFIVGVNSALIVAGLTGALTPATTALLHNISTVAVSANAMRPLLGER
ncbi:MAG: heavy metal translocating P-type ATPase [Deferribacterales bacterium]|nr:heavy metal translocating P-type ATPase [Deferribacterales bacterium]